MLLKKFLNFLFIYLNSNFKIIVFALFLTACSSQPALMPTPNIYAKNKYLDEKVPSSLRKTNMQLLYVTDRSPAKSGTIKYNTSRSNSISFGVANVGLGDKSIQWDDLVIQSNQRQRSSKLLYSMDDINELGRYPATPYAFKIINNKVQIVSEVVKKKNISELSLSDNIKDRLKESAKKDLILYVHGFNNTFNESVFTLAGIWHFLNRQGVPLVYSWPAAKGGLTGYFTDRESGEFTIYHLKETLRLLFDIKEIQNIHIIAHSRGTDVVTSALRELVIEHRAKGGNLKQDLKIANLILAAPDLDFGVITQRLMAEQFGTAFGQITIYTSEGDKALDFSQWLMSSLRFGKLKSKDVGLNERNIFNAVGNVSLIKVPRSGGFIGHDYFHSNPAVSSDLIQLIKHKALPGSKERPLKRIENNFWSLQADYLFSN